MKPQEEHVNLLCKRLSFLPKEEEEEEKNMRKKIKSAESLSEASLEPICCHALRGLCKGIHSFFDPQR